MPTKIFIAGHRGLVGSALVRCFSESPKYTIITRTRAELDLTDQKSTQDFLEKERPEEMIIAAAKVGGIKANYDYPVEFLLNNMRIQNNLIEGAYKIKMKKLLFLGSSCIYPKFAPQPIKEDSLLTGTLEPTNEAYAIAKIAGIRLCQAYRREYGANFISTMPTNIYGPYDNYNPETSHVLPGLIYKFHKAKIENSVSVTLWGTGSPRRELLYSDDLASACMFLMEKYEGSEIINVGTGEDATIREIAEMTKEAVGFKGEIIWDTSKPDGTPRKQLDVSNIRKLGWKHKIQLQDGIKMAYAFYRDHIAK